MEDGGFFRLPISAFCKKPFELKELPLDELVMWNSFSYVSVTTFYEISGSQCNIHFGKDKKKRQVSIYY